MKIALNALSLLSTFIEEETGFEEMKRPGHSHTSCKCKWHRHENGHCLVVQWIEGPLFTPEDGELPTVPS